MNSDQRIKRLLFPMMPSNSLPQIQFSVLQLPYWKSEIDTACPDLSQMPEVPIKLLLQSNKVPTSEN
jgi:hypothetical protein